MLRINLLPPYIYEGAKRRNVYVLWVVLLLAAIGGLIFWKIQLGNEADRIAKETEALKPTQNEAKSTQTKADALVASNAGLKAKAVFVRSANKYNTETYQPLLGSVGTYTISRVLYSSMVPSGQTINLSAYAPSLSDVGHYIMAMEKNPNVTNVAIAMNSIPDFPNETAPTREQQIGFNFQGLGQAGGAGTMGAGPQMGRPMGASSGASAGSKFGNLQSAMSMMGGGGGQRGRRGGGDAGGGGGFGGGQQTGPADRPAGGHDFTVTLTLDQKVAIPAPPSYGGGGGGQPGAGAPMLGGAGTSTVGAPTAGGAAGKMGGGGKMGGMAGAGAE